MFIMSPLPSSQSLIYHACLHLPVFPPHLSHLLLHFPGLSDSGSWQCVPTILMPSIASLVNKVFVHAVLCQIPRIPTVAALLSASLTSSFSFACRLIVRPNHFHFCRPHLPLFSPSPEFLLSGSGLASSFSYGASSPLNSA